MGRRSPSWAVLVILALGIGSPACGGKSVRNDGTGGSTGDDDDPPPSRPTCETLCARASACPNADGTPCVAACSSTEDVVRAAGCQVQWTRYLECVGQDVCLSGRICFDESNDLASCLSSFCSAVPERCVF